MVKCCLCQKKIEVTSFGWKEGNNALPLKDGRCCDLCNSTKVIPARIKNISGGNKFGISDGNLKVLETIPLMMKDKNYRTELRRLTLNFLTNSNANKINFHKFTNNAKKLPFWNRYEWDLIEDEEFEK